MRELQQKPLPQYAIDALQKSPIEETTFGSQKRSCQLLVPEDQPLPYIHPESFDFCDVYGECELIQIIQKGEESAIMIAKHQYEKNHRSFDQEAATNFGYSDTNKFPIQGEDLSKEIPLEVFYG